MSTIAKGLKPFQILLSGLKDLYHANSYVRIISICSASFITLLLSRNIGIKLYWRYQNLPTKTYVGIPLIGIAFKIFDPQFYIKNKSTLMTTKLGTDTTVIIGDPRIVRKLYGMKGMTDLTLSMTDDIFSNANGEQWSVRRKYIYGNLMTIMNRDFVENSTKKLIIDSLFPIFDDNARNNIDITDARAYFRQFGFNVVLNACFGKELTGFNDPFFKEFDALNANFLETQMDQIQFDVAFGYNNKLWRNIVCPTIFGDHWSILFDKLSKLIENYANDTNNAIKTDNGATIFTDFIKNYENTKEYHKHKDLNITKKKLYADMTITMFAAIDTSYAAILSCCILAAKYGDIQERVYNELKSIFNSPNDVTLSNNKLLSLHLFRAFIHEILRVVSSAAVAGFRTIKRHNVTIKDEFTNKTYNIPKGCGTMINVQGINFNKNYWTLPNGDTLSNNGDISSINLEFWLDNDGKFDKKRNGKNLFTFSYGKRDCVGRSLAMKQIYTVMAVLLLKYKFIPPQSNPSMSIKHHGIGSIVIPSRSDFAIQIRT